MTFAGPALDNAHKIRAHFPTTFKHAEVMEKMGWNHAVARQAIVMGVSQDLFRILGAEDPRTGYVLYENVGWRKSWLTRPWVSDWVRELESAA